MRNECNIVRDILPLYVEHMVSDDTASFVEEHLESCAECREKLTKLKKTAEIADMDISVSTDYVNEAAPLKVVKKRLRRKQVLTILLSFVAAAVFVGSVVFVLFIWGFSANSENIKLETEFQYSRMGYHNRQFVLHVTQLHDKPINVYTKDVYQTDENGKYVYDEYGHKLKVGYEIYVNEIPFGKFEPDNFTMGYIYDVSVEGPTPSDDFDFTLTVIFKDTTIVYSMVEEGLFIP